MSVRRSAAPARGDGQRTIAILRPGTRNQIPGDRAALTGVLRQFDFAPGIPGQAFVPPELQGRRTMNITTSINPEVEPTWRAKSSSRSITTVTSFG